MPEYSTETREKIDALREIYLAGEMPEVYELAGVDWGAPTGTIWYSVLQTDEATDPPPPVSPIEARLVPANDPAWFLPVDLNAAIGDEEVDLPFYDADGAISDLLEAHGEGVKVKLNYWFPQVELLLPIWEGHLRQEEEATAVRLPLVAIQGFRSADALSPSRQHYRECQRIFGGILGSAAEIAEYGCNYNLHLDGGTIGTVDPATSLPWTFCDRRDHDSCTVRGINPRRHLSHLTITASVVNNQTRGPRLISTSQGNESYLTEPVRVVMGTRYVYGMPLMAFRRDRNNNNPDHGWFLGMYEVSEGEIAGLSQVEVTVGGRTKPVEPQHYGRTLGTVEQAPLLPQLSGHGYANTAHFYFNFGWVNPEEVDESQCTASGLVTGHNKIRVYTDATTFTRQWTANPVWQLLEIMTNKIWGYGMDHSLFAIEAWIEAAAWAAQSVIFTDFAGTAWPHIRAASHPEFIGRKVQQQIEDICTESRLSLPFMFDGKIHIVPLKRLTDEELAAAPVFTDEGHEPNIIWDEGEDGVEITTLTRQRTSVIDLVNRIECTYDSMAQRNQKTPLQPVEDIDMQLAAGRLAGDHSRKQNPKQYSLIGVTDEARAMKIAWSLLDLGPLDTGGKENNLTLTFRIWFADALELHPWKVIRLNSSSLTRYGFDYFRIMKIKRLAGLEYELTVQAYARDYMATFETTPGEPIPGPGPGETPIPPPGPPCSLNFGDIRYEDGVLDIEIEECLPLPV